MGKEFAGHFGYKTSDEAFDQLQNKSQEVRLVHWSTIDKLPCNLLCVQRYGHYDVQRYGHYDGFILSQCFDSLCLG